MSIEGNCTVRRNASSEIATNKETNIRSADLASFTVNEYLRPYLSEGPGNPFISPTIAKELKCFIPQLIVNVLVSSHEALKEDEQLAIGGSSIEVFSGLISSEYYWAIKEHFVNILATKAEINKDARSFIPRSLKALAYGDADLDMYVEKNSNLESIFNKFHDLYPQSDIEPTKTGGNEFKIQIPGSNINLTTYFGPAQNDNSRKRLYLRLKNAQDKPLFHIDITTKETLGGASIFDRRKKAGSIHNRCQAQINAASGEVSIDMNAIPKASELSQIILEGKDIKTIPEIVMREMRKKLFHISSDKEAREKISIHQLFPLLSTDDIFSLRDLTSNPDHMLEKSIHGQSEHQKDILYRELFLMAQVDPYLTISFLQDTGFDRIFFGRHLTRREVLRVLTSDWLKQDEQTNNNTPVESINESRKQFLNTDIANPARNGFLQLVSAIGNALGPSSDLKNFEKHFTDGLSIINDPELLPILKIQTDLPSDEKAREMYETIINWGGLTETALHSILNKNDPEKYPIETEDDKKNFRLGFLKLKTSGLLEVARRDVVTDKRSIEVFFYYPSIDRRNTYELLPWTEDGHKKPNPNNSGYWKTLIEQGSFEQFAQVSSIIPADLTHAWINLAVLEITSLESLLGIRESDWIIIEKQFKGHFQIADYGNINLIRKFLISRQAEVLKEEKIRSWIYPDWDT